MSKPKITRTAAREIAVRLSFRLDGSEDTVEDVLDEFFQREYYDTLSDEDKLFNTFPDTKQMEYIYTIVNGIVEKKPVLDELIEKYAKGWKISRISKTALSILRCALYEIIYMDEVPTGAAINEAVELSKSYEEEDTVSFINGILGSVMRGEDFGSK